MLAHIGARHRAGLPTVLLQDGHVVLVSDQFSALTGYKKEDLVNMAETEILSKLRANFDFRNFSDKKYLYIFTKNLEPREIRVTVSAEEHGKQVIFKEKHISGLDRSLFYVEQKISFNIERTAIFSTEDFLLLKANQMFLDFLDEPYNSRVSSIGKSLHQTVTGWTGSPSNTLWKNVADSGEPYINKTSANTGLNKGTIYSDLMIIPIVSEGNVKYLVVTMKDVTDDILNRETVEEQGLEIAEKKQQYEIVLLQQKQMQEDLKQQKERLEAFLNSLSHELRNPLATVVAGISLMDMLEVNPKSRETLDILKRQTNQMRSLIDDLLDMTRISRNTLILRAEQFDLNKLALSVAWDYKIIFSDQYIQLEIDIGEKPLMITADPVRISQIIGNLLDNSLKFTKSGGKTTLSVHEQNSSAYITVSDNGKGIDSEFLPFLFEPFSQADNAHDRQNSGLGLGLSLVKGIAELHDGAVTAHSDGLDKGSQFTILLPIQCHI